MPTIFETSIDFDNSSASIGTKTSLANEGLYTSKDVILSPADKDAILAILTPYLT